MRKKWPIYVVGALALVFLFAMRLMSLDVLSRNLNSQDALYFVLWEGKTNVISHDVLFYANKPPTPAQGNWQVESLERIAADLYVPLPQIYRDSKNWSKMTCQVVRGDGDGPILFALVGWPERHLFWLLEEHGW